MLSGIVNYFSGLLHSSYGLHIPLADVQRYSRQAKASEWHTFAINKRPWRPHVCIPCSWIAHSQPLESHVFEVGCGSGANLFWLYQAGFRHLAGSDISAPAVDMCALLAQHLHAPVEVRVDNALAPQHLPGHVDVLLSVNWLYHVPGATLEHLLELYSPCISPQGCMVFDMIDSSHNAVKNNRYHTKDRHLPRAQRRPSEYVLRMSAEEVGACVARFGFRIVQQKNLYIRPRRNIFLIQKA